MSDTSWWMSFDPVRPWSIPGAGPLLLLFVAALLVGLTLWTYAGVPRSGRWRVAVLIFLRLTALVLACLAMVRPSLASRDNQRERSHLILLLDASASMEERDEFNSQSRWDALRRTLSRCEPTLKQLREEQNVEVQLYRFAEGLGDYDPNGKADGKRTDYGTALHDLYTRNGGKGPYLGLFLISDGLDNGTRYVTRDEIEKWRKADCPLYTFVTGQATTSSETRDIILTRIAAESVPIKAPLHAKGFADVYGYKRPEVRARLILTQDVKEGDKEIIVEEKKLEPQKFVLDREKENELPLSTTAPEKPGEIKVTFRIDPVDAGDTPANNARSTYVTIAKEGLSVLYVDRLRPGEPRAIRAALHDPRINLVMLHRQEGPLTEAEEKLFRFEEQHFDVIIIGDLSFQRLSGGNIDVARRIYDMVFKKGTGIVFLGGYQTFGNSDWQNVRWKDEKGVEHSLAELFPVELKAAGQDELGIQMVPTDKGLAYYLMKLSDKPGQDRALWESLPKLRGMTRLGNPKENATTLATAGNAEVPLLVAKDFGAGRTLAFGADTTWRWRNLGLPERAEGIPLHERFWKQVVIWLAKQEDAAGSIWVKADPRPEQDPRALSSGDQLGFTAGARGKNGEPLEGVTLKANVYLLKEKSRDGSTITLSKELVREGILLTHGADGVDHGAFDKTDQPGEYQVEVRAWPKGQAEPLKDVGKLRFLVEQSTAEQLVRAASPAKMAELARLGGNGKRAFRLEELPKVLEDLRNQPQPTGKGVVKFRPDWGRDGSNGFLFGYLFAFASLLGLEWFLRRSWGLV